MYDLPQVGFYKVLFYSILFDFLQGHKKWLKAPGELKNTDLCVMELLQSGLQKVRIKLTVGARIIRTPRAFPCKQVMQN